MKYDHFQILFFLSKIKIAYFNFISVLKVLHSTIFHSFQELI